MSIQKKFLCSAEHKEENNPNDLLSRQTTIKNRALSDLTSLYLLWLKLVPVIAQMPLIDYNQLKGQLTSLESGIRHNS